MAAISAADILLNVTLPDFILSFKPMAPNTPKIQYTELVDHWVDTHTKARLQSPVVGNVGVYTQVYDFHSLLTKGVDGGGGGK